MKYYEVDQCNEFCPFYHQWISEYGQEKTTLERCSLLGWDYNDPKQVLVRLWAKRRREVEDNYKHVRIIDRPDIDEIFPPTPDFCPIKDRPVVVLLQHNKWHRWEGKSPLYDHYGDSPVGRMKKQLQREKEEKQKAREQRRLEKELKMKEKEQKRLQKQKKSFGTDENPSGGA